MTEDTRKPAEEVEDEALDQAQGGVNIARGRTTIGGTTLDAGVNINNDYQVVQGTTFNTAGGGTSVDADEISTGDITGGTGVNINNDY